MSAMPIDSSIYQKTFGGSVGPDGEVWLSYSIISGEHFVQLFVADLKSDYVLLLKELQDAIYSRLAIEDISDRYWVVETNGVNYIQEINVNAPLVLNVRGYYCIFCISIRLAICQISNSIQLFQFVLTCGL